MPKHINIDQTALANFCKRHKIVKLSLFGSILRDDFGPGSDIDVLIEFEHGAEVGLITLAAMEFDLAALLKVQEKIDLRTPDDLSRYFRDEVMKAAEVQYAA